MRLPEGVPYGHFFGNLKIRIFQKSPFFLIWHSESFCCIFSSASEKGVISIFKKPSASEKARPSYVFNQESIYITKCRPFEWIVPRKQVYQKKFAPWKVEGRGASRVRKIPLPLNLCSCNFFHFTTKTQPKQKTGK